ncbi:MAG: elongation factor G [Myxococcales bacterium]|nr:elongation factor G [Myxococcales bacterium]
MKKYETAALRNIGLVGHAGTGKTALGEMLLLAMKVTSKLGKTADQTSTFDYEPEEIKRESSISPAIAGGEWKKARVTVIDTPGDANFFLDTHNCMTVIDTAVVVVSAVDGVQVQTDKAWSIAEELALPRVVFVNKMDRERADFDAAVDDLRKNLSDKIVAVQVPIGSEDKFEGMVDLLSGKAYRFAKDGSGSFQVVDVPAELKDRVAEAREKLIDGIAASDDALTEKYLEQGTLSEEEALQGLRKGIVAGTFVPALCGASTLAIGAAPLLDLVIGSCPSPVDRPPRKVKRPGSEEVLERAADPAAPFCGQVFKTLVDQFTGRMTLLRVWSGTLKTETGFYNVTRGVRERFNAILWLQGKKQESGTEAGPGEIVAVAKLKETMTGDSLAEEKDQVVFPPLPAVVPAITFALRPKTKNDEDKIGQALPRLLEEDSTLQVSHDTEAKEILLSGMGQVHIEVTVEKLRRKFGVEVDLLPPKIPYRETIKGRAQNVEGKHKKQTGGRGQFGVAYLNMEPLPRGSGFEFVDQIVGGAIPRQWIPSVEKGIVAAAKHGPLAGFPVVDFRVTVIDGKYHDVDSSDMSFQLAGSKGFKAAIKQCKPTLLEPIMNVEIVCPDECMGDVMGDINQRRGRVLGMDSKGRMQVIKAQAPMSEMLRYSSDLRQITGGRGAFTMGFSHYDEVPAQLQDRIIQESGRKVEEEEEE